VRPLPDLFRSNSSTTTLQFWESHHWLGFLQEGWYISHPSCANTSPTRSLTPTYVFPMAKHLGLSLIHEAETFSITNDTRTVDIIALHGLTGNRETTWTVAESGVNWLRDFLPDLPGARVLTFGYDSDWYNYNLHNNISSIAEHLLGTLAEHRGHGPKVKKCYLILHSSCSLRIELTLD